MLPFCLRGNTHTFAYLYYNFQKVRPLEFSVTSLYSDWLLKLWILQSEKGYDFGHDIGYDWL